MLQYFVINQSSEYSGDPSSKNRKKYFVISVIKFQRKLKVCKLHMYVICHVHCPNSFQYSLFLLNTKWNLTLHRTKIDYFYTEIGITDKIKSCCDVAFLQYEITLNYCQDLFVSDSRELTRVSITINVELYFFNLCTLTCFRDVQGLTGFSGAGATIRCHHFILHQDREISVR